MRDRPLKRKPGNWTCQATFRTMVFSVSATVLRMFVRRFVTADQVSVKKEFVYFGARQYYQSRYGEAVSNQ